MQLPRSALISVCTVALLWHFAPHPSALGQRQDAPSPTTLSDDDIRQQLIGSWRIVSASFGGVPSELHEKSITIKHITPVHIIWIGYQPDDRRIFRSAGGSWNVTQGKYTETMRVHLSQFKFSNISSVVLKMQPSRLELSQVGTQQRRSDTTYR
jgi:hypothetical protein